MIEYANQLAEKGHEVVIYYALQIPYLKSNTPVALRWVYFNLFTPPHWFKLHSSIRRKVVVRVADNTIADGDIIFYTWWALSYDIKNLNPAKGKVFNLIQDLEFWTGHEEEVKKSYFLPEINNVVIAAYIRKFIQSIQNVPVKQIPFAIDHEKFRIKKAIAERNPISVCMMYSREPRKGSKIGLAAIQKLRRQFPKMEVNLFSVFDFEEETELTEGINFYKRPSDLPDIMNRAAVFISPSIQEGCALPPMEAMHCGCALVCSDIEGHSEYAFDNQTALLFKTEDVDSLVEKVTLLFADQALRDRIATAGNAFIKKNTWSYSTDVLLSVFSEEL